MNPFEERLLKKPFLIATHRGLHGGNIIENTIEAARLAFAAGSDLVEVDVCRTADGAYFLFHDGMEPMRYGMTQNFQTLSARDVEERELHNALGAPSGKVAVRLSDFLAALAPGELVNLDRSWFFWEDGFLEVLAKMGKKRQILLKSPARKGLLERVAATDFYYMPIIENPAAYDLCLAIDGLSMVGVEWVLRDVSDWDPTFVERLHRDGRFLFVNAETLDGSTGLFGPWTDDRSLRLGFQEGWGALLMHGADVIQTDWPMLLEQERTGMMEEISRKLTRSREERFWTSPPDDLEAIAVYGYALSAQGDIQPMLERRLQVALKVAQSHPDALVLLSGGQPRNDCLECEKMRDWLIEHGVDRARMIEDPLACETVDNQRGFLQMLQSRDLHRVCLVSGRVHMPRCLLGLESMAEASQYPLELSVAYAEDDAESPLVQSVMQMGEKWLALRNYLRCSGRNSYRAQLSWDLLMKERGLV